MSRPARQLPGSSHLALNRQLSDTSWRLATGQRDPFVRHIAVKRRFAETLRPLGNGKSVVLECLVGHLAEGGIAVDPRQALPDDVRLTQVPLVRNQQVQRAVGVLRGQGSPSLQSHMLPRNCRCSGSCSLCAAMLLLAAD